MTYKGHITNGAVVLDDPVHLRDGTLVRIEVMAEETSTMLHTDIEGFTGVLPADIDMRDAYARGMLQKHS